MMTLFSRLVLILMILVPALGRAQAGNASLAFLKLGISGRGAAMADAMSATVAGAAATYYNPAGLLPIVSTGSRTELLAMHREWIQDTRTEFLGASLGLGVNDGLGISVTTTTVSDIEIRTRPGEPDGTFTARDFAAGLSYARRLTDGVRVGMTARFLYEKIFLDESSGYAFDAGAQVATPVDGLDVGLQIANVGSMAGLRGGTATLPSLARAGAAYSMVLEEVTPVALTVATDLMHVFPEKRSYINAGAEVTLVRQIAIRGGYQFGSKGRGLSAGVGVAHGIISVDYAFSRLAADLGNGHVISLALAL